MFLLQLVFKVLLSPEPQRSDLLAQRSDVLHLTSGKAGLPFLRAQRACGLAFPFTRAADG